MPLSSLVYLAVIMLCVLVSPHVVAQAAPPVANGKVPPNANTTDPAVPFYIDLTGLDLSTVPPTRDPRSPNYPAAIELPDGQVPPISGNGNYIIGPSHPAAPETIARPAVPKGRIVSFTMASTESGIYRPGLVRIEATFDGGIYSAPSAEGDPSHLIITTSVPGTWTRAVSIYVPPQYTRATRAPFLVIGDGGLFDATIFATLDNLISQRRIPPIVAIAIGNGGQDAQGAQRGLEYDTVSGTYAQWVEQEVLPRVEKAAGVRLTRDPDGRATMGISSSGAAAFTMAWFHPELYRRVLSYSPTFVNQQWPQNPALRGGAWEYHSEYTGPPTPYLNVDGFNLPTPTDVAPGSPLIASNPRKPIRIWFEVGDRDLFYPIVSMADGMHDWVLANQNMARALAAAGYEYQFVFSRNAGHVDSPTLHQTLPAALEWVWRGYRDRQPHLVQD